MDKMFDETWQVKEVAVRLKLLLKALVIVVAVLIVYVSAENRKVPAGILEWLFLIGAFVIISASIINGCYGRLG